ncbi:long-chain-fatty-acid--CoA ligase [Nocardia sp. NBC_00511]|uniref:long-chain-fatty-acid--CoA ligase n=1 Tax=Nocardia sp. NBC_00511 TaxID=2903591 RepID=UPI002F911DA3
MRISDCVERATQINADGPATVFGERISTWAQINDRVARLAAGLVQLGAMPGTRVAMLAFNSDRYLEFILAVSWFAGLFVPINTRLAVPEIRFWLEDSGSEVVIVDDSFVEPALALRKKGIAVTHWLYAGEGTTPDGFVDFEELIAGSVPVGPQRGDARAAAGIFYTGGTTGRSKGVVHSHASLLASAMHLLAHLRWDRMTNYLHAAPMFHLADGAGTFATLLTAGCHTMIPRFGAATMAEAIEEYRVTTSVVVPTMLKLLVEEPTTRDRDLSSLTSLVYGGSPIPMSVQRTAAEVIGQVELYQLYGQTEAAPMLTILGPEYHVIDGPRAKYNRSAGRAAIGCQVAIVGPDGQALGPGHEGEICGRGDNVMLGYWNQPELTEQTLRAGWLHTGDIGYLNGDGFLFVVDRAKDMIVSGGENVYSTEVENAIHGHPAVAECAVIGIPSRQWGEQVHAVVRLREGRELTEEELLNHCRGLIASYKVPRSVRFHDEPLPTSAAGKLLKSVLREPYWASHTERVH